MLPEIREYLEEVRCRLRLDPATERQVIGELCTHFEEELAELKLRHLSESQAARVAIEAFGRARVIARLMYEAYSKGSWADAALASMPHLLLAVLFAAHLWRHPVIAPAAFFSIVGITILGWWRGKPGWLYSWVGYALFPLLVGGFFSPAFVQEALALLPLPGLWMLLIVAAGFGFFGRVIIGTIVRVTRRDWILVSLMLVPLPILGSWLYNVERAGGLFQDTIPAYYQWDTTLALAFSVLAVASAAFIRLRQRRLKIGAIIVFGTIALSMVADNLSGGLGFFGLLALFILMPAFLFAPAALEARIGHGERAEAWWRGYQPGESTSK